MNKTNFQHGTVVTPGFLNAINNAVCKKTPIADGEVQSPSFDQLQDASWLTRPILEELFLSLGLRASDHMADALSGAVLAAFVRLFGASADERSAYISKLIGFINTLGGDPADFVMDMSDHVTSIALAQSNAALKIGALEDITSRRDRWMLESDNANITFVNFSADSTESMALDSSRALIQTAPGNSGYYFNACFRSRPRKSSGVGSVSIRISDNTSADSFFSKFVSDLFQIGLSGFPVVNFLVEYPAFCKAGLTDSYDVKYLSLVGPQLEGNSEFSFKLLDIAGRDVLAEKFINAECSCVFKISMFVPTPHA